MLACLMICATLHAQEKQMIVKYKSEQKEFDFIGRKYISGKPTETEVIAYGNYVISRKFTGMGHANLTVENMRSAALDSIFNNYIMLDYNKQQLFAIVRVRGKMHLNEPLNCINWKLDNDSKSILNYQCSKATCSFRGREYVAYFTRELPFKAGPWKFHGLPGVILEVSSTDGYCSWVAEGLVIKPFKQKIKPPFNELEKVDLKQYKRILQNDRRKHAEHQKKMKIKAKANGVKMFFAPDPKEFPQSIEIFDLE
ncbi:GLPGLI family protein [Marinifilum sp.]|uniref:GLPGLI family protein n=1 Tax=Marinifilum sp. TaxID=2033137 RepID=UPI003BAB0D96